MTGENDQSSHNADSVAAFSQMTSSVTPDQSPVPDLDWQAFRNYMIRAESGDTTVPAAFVSFVNSSPNGGFGDSKEDDRRRQDYLIWQLMAENLRLLDELIEIKSIERDQLLENIESDKKALERFNRHRQGMERAEAYRDRHGSYELNANGELEDEDAEDMLQAWEGRSGRKLDRNNADEVRAAFREQLRFEDDEALRLQRELENKRDRIGKLNEEIGELGAAEKKAQAALQSGESPEKLSADLQRQLLARGIGTEEERQRLAEAQGISLSQVQAIVESNAEEWGPQVSSQLNRAVGSASQKTLGIAPAAPGLQTSAPSKR